MDLRLNSQFVHTSKTAQVCLETAACEDAEADPEAEPVAEPRLGRSIAQNGSVHGSEV